MAISVWDFPRPPRLEPEPRRVRVVLGGSVVADTTDALRVLETSHPPGIYLPPDAWLDGALHPARARSTWCEFKGAASYLDVVAPDGTVAPAAGWTYERPTAGFEPLAGFVSVYPGRVERCLLDDEEVRPQDGGFYGGWITAELEGPFKGPPGTLGW